MKVRFITHWYADPVPARYREQELAVERQLATSDSSAILAIDPCPAWPGVIHIDHRPTYAELAAQGSDDPQVINLLTNTDCYIDPEDMPLLERVEVNRIWCISRTDLRVACSQDAWAWRGRLDVPEANHVQGNPGVDNKFAFDAAATGLIPINPGLTIRLHHLHASQVRRITQADRTHGNYLFVEPVKLGEVSRLEYRGDEAGRKRIAHLSHLFADLKQ